MSDGTTRDMPMRAVKESRLRGGASIFSSIKYHWWELHLECGHMVERRIRYLPPADGSRPPRGWAAQHRGVPMTRIPDKRPQRARCDQCIAGRT